VPAPFPVTPTAQRLRPHSPLWFPRQTSARHPPAALLSTTRSSTAITDRSGSLFGPGTEPTGSVPNAAAAWWSSRDLRLPKFNSVLPPLSPESPHDTTIPISLIRCL